MIGGRVLDTSAILDAATGRSVYARALIRTAVEHGLVLSVPAGALTAAWAGSPVEGRPFLDLVLDLPVVVVDQLDAATAESAGLVLADAGAEPPAIDTGHVAVSARRRGWPVVTAHPERLHALAPDLEVEPLP